MFLVDFICTNLPLKKDEKIELLRIDSLRERTYRLLEILNREVQLAEIKASIQMRAREDIDQQQREYFLQQQIKTIQDELGGGGQEQEIEEMRQKGRTHEVEYRSAGNFPERACQAGTYPSSIAGLQCAVELSADNAQSAVGSLYYRQFKPKECRENAE